MEATLWPSFDDFYDLYDKKRGRPNAEKFWAKLTQREKEECMAAVPAYVAATPNKVYRKDPERYLRHKAFSDEIIGTTTSQHGTLGTGSSLDQKRREVLEHIARRSERAGPYTDPSDQP